MPLETMEIVGILAFVALIGGVAVGLARLDNAIAPGGEEQAEVEAALPGEHTTKPTAHRGDKQRARRVKPKHR